jgi:uncharacterized protein YcfJ
MEANMKRASLLAVLLTVFYGQAQAGWNNDAVLGGALGGAAGAAIGAAAGGRDAAIIGGLLGGAAGVAIATQHGQRQVIHTRYVAAPRYREVYYSPRSYHDNGRHRGFQHRHGYGSHAGWR